MTMGNVPSPIWNTGVSSSRLDRIVTDARACTVSPLMLPDCPLTLPDCGLTVGA